jgi:aspartate aminotransferase
MNSRLRMSSRVDGLEPEGAYRVLARAQELERVGRDIIHLEIGEPDFATDATICRSGIAAVEAGHTRYNPTAGIAELRGAIADDASRRRGIDVSPENVVVGPGAKPLLLFPTLALVQQGDEVAYPDPGFPTYEAMIRVAGGVPVPIPLLERKGFSFDLDALRDRVNPRTRMIVLNSPGNPTGGVLPVEDLKQIAELARQLNCWVLSDEIYGRMCYDGADAPSIASLPGMQERTVVVDGFSKTYAMSGWRLGYGVMPSPLAEKVSLLLVHGVGCTAHFTQWAGLQAIAGPQDHVAEMVFEYQRRRDRLVSGLNSIDGVQCQTPAGAFYAFPNVRAWGRPTAELADMLLEKAGVALLPGTAFGDQGEGFLRLCYANSIENIERAVERMRDALGRLNR